MDLCGFCGLWLSQYCRPLEFPNGENKISFLEFIEYMNTFIIEGEQKKSGQTVLSLEAIS